MIVEVSINAKSNQLFEVHFQEFFLTYLVDQVYQIRIHGNNLLPRILEIEPIAWVTNVLIPRIQKLRATDPSYLKRVTSLYAYERLVKLNPRDLQHACISEVVFELKDKVPNIRLVALKVLRSILAAVDEQHKQTIKASVAPLVADPDADVKALAQSIVQA